MSISPNRRSLRLRTRYSPHSISKDDSMLLNLSKPNIKKTTNYEIQQRNKPNKDTQLNEKRINYVCVTQDLNFGDNTENYSEECLFGFCNESNEYKQLNHKYYGCRKKTSHEYGESFGLPDQPIFSNTPMFSNQKERSPLDTHSVDPWDINVLDLKLIDQPWLVEYPEVITPYWDVESLFPFDDIRKKNEPEFIDCYNEWTNENLNFSVEIIENAPNNCMYTSTPLKKKKFSTSLISTINITKDGQDIDIAHLKNQVVKALEEAIKDKELANIDMKIKVLKKSKYKNKSYNEFEDIQSNIRTIKFSKPYNSLGNINISGGHIIERNNEVCNMTIPKRALRSNVVSEESVSFNVTNKSVSKVVNDTTNKRNPKRSPSSLHNKFLDLDSTDNFKKKQHSNSLFSTRSPNIQEPIQYAVDNLQFNNKNLDENVFETRELRSHTLKSNIVSCKINKSEEICIPSWKFYKSPRKAFLSSSLPKLKFKEKDESVCVKLENFSDYESHDKEIDLYSHLKIKTEIDDYHQEVFPYKAGELVWAQLAKYPYWPAFICYDPENNIYCRHVNKENKLTTIYYHIRFFGDNGRRAWIHKNHLMLYCSQHDLELIVSKLKSERKAYNALKPYIISGGQIIQKWNKAIEELESVKGQTYDKIHAYLLNCWDKFRDFKKQRKAEKNKSVSILQPKSSKRKQPTTENLNSNIASKKFKKDVATYVGQNVQLKSNSKIKNASQINSVVKGKSENLKTIEETGGERPNVNVIQEKNVYAFHSDNQRKLDNPKQKDNPADTIHGKKIEKHSYLKPKPNADVNHFMSNLYSFEYQTELHRKNNLFNGFRNIKVCDYCLKQDNIFKCKGKCCNYYHLECASNMYQKNIIKKNARKIEYATKHNDQYETSNKTIQGSRNEIKHEQVQIITVKSNHTITAPLKMDVPPELSLAEQIDYKMKEVMSILEYSHKYQNYSSSEECSTTSLEKSDKGSLCNVDLNLSISSDKGNCHVTADSEILNEEKFYFDPDNFKCSYCVIDGISMCFVCGLEVSIKGTVKRKKCSYYRCGKYFHEQCLKAWPQTQWSIGKWSKNNDTEDTFTCPSHTCHTCFSDEFGSNSRSINEKLARCVRCPAAFHATNFCIPAGSVILGGSQIICPRHGNKAKQPINTFWCFICSKGGNLICCDTCPTSIHPECQPITLTDDDKYICEDCESGRFPLYDEIVWVKLGHYRWWPALILFPNEIPENIKSIKHQEGDFVVRFFGTNDHYWVNKSRSFLFQEGDTGGSLSELNKPKNRINTCFKKAIEDATLAFKLKKEYKMRREAEIINNLKPPPFVKINKNKPIGNVKTLELNVSSVNACECDPNKPYPCGPDSDCINRLLMTECDPEICAATTNCWNQAFQKREYVPVVPCKTQGRGWGLKCLAPIKKGQFIIEYVGELIDSEEYQRRISKMHAQKDENYYFMTIDSERVIDAGPKGNYSRFMNHSCDPNCVTQKWTIKGETRVGLFANCDIEADSELTFNYNLEVVGQEKKVCKCGAPNCSGFIGVKAKIEKPEKLQNELKIHNAKNSSSRSKKSLKKKSVLPQAAPSCFICNQEDANIICNNKACNKGYHRKCLNLNYTSDASKFICPRHNCNICSNRTIRCCVKCTNSFCPTHAETNVRHDKFLGFVCRVHDPEKTEIGTLKSVKKRRRTSNLDQTHDSEVSSTTLDEELHIKKQTRSRKNGVFNSKATVESVQLDLVTSSPLKSHSLHNSNSFKHKKNRRKRKKC
ncbi:nuclear receptor binding SET domain protein [Rhynchophorus ferrugineus]|uniref:nuclear receptor binding SET domain protein n=1 Tax=Rhynchophorus ferrugineus TaxID=354439 RepID=UPI003FCD7FFA